MGMAEKKLNEEGQEVVDGREVSGYSGKFRNTFEMDFEQAAPLVNGDFITLVVTAQVGVPKFTGVKDGSIRRTNIMDVVDTRVLDNDEAMFLLQNMGESNPSEVNPHLATVSHLPTTPTLDLGD